LDEAFLRRRRSKVKVDYVSRPRFVKIFRLYWDRYHLDFDPEAVEYLLRRYYDDGNAGFLPVIPGTSWSRSWIIVGSTSLLPVSPRKTWTGPATVIL
jgi:hypothetical protein